MDDFNFYALWGLPFAVLFILNGVWDNSPFVIPYFKRLQEERFGEQALKTRMILTGVGLLVMCGLLFFKVIGGQ